MLFLGKQVPLKTEILKDARKKVHDEVAASKGEKTLARVIWEHYH